MAADKCILTVNFGSSSLKFALVAKYTRVVFGTLERIGLRAESSKSRPGPASRLRPRISRITTWPSRACGVVEVIAARHRGGRHRLAHGGRGASVPAGIGHAPLPALRQSTAFVPEHLPQEIHAIERLLRQYRTCRRCHVSIPRSMLPLWSLALVPLPRVYWDRGAIRYGFHGRSYEYILQELRREIGEELGNGYDRAPGQRREHGGHPRGQAGRDDDGVDFCGRPHDGTGAGDLESGVTLFLMEQGGLSWRRCRS